MCYLRALSVKHDHINANTNLGHLCRIQGRWEEAKEHYKTALQRRPDDPLLLYNVALVLEKIGMPEDIKVSIDLLVDKQVILTALICQD